MLALAPELHAKEAALEARLRSAGRVLVAFSGGVDSSYLAWVAQRELGERALAVTAVSPSYPASHREMAERIVRDFGIRHRFVDTHELDNPDYRANRGDRLMAGMNDETTNAMVAKGLAMLKGNENSFGYTMISFGAAMSARFNGRFAEARAQFRRSFQHSAAWATIIARI